MKSSQEIESSLAQCIGTEQYWKNPTLHFQYTDGVKIMWESCEAYWLLTAISSYKRTEHFQVWELVVNEDDKTAILTMIEDTDQPILVKQEIEYTDFPLESMTLWLIDGVLILPSEY